MAEKLRVGVNGFGRIGRYFTRLCLERSDIEGDVLTTDNQRSIRFTQYKSPADIPWADLGVDMVIESTGLFLTKEKAEQHLVGGAKKVILSAPSEGEDILNMVMGVNDDRLSAADIIVSNASCPTNSAAPLIAVMREIS